MGNYCMYLRKSRADAEAEARGEGETLARHEKLLLEVAKRSKYNVTKIYKELVSGETIAARPQMQILLQEVEKGVWDGVLVVEVERLARGDTIDQGIVSQAFKYSGTKIITPVKVYDPNNEFDEEYFEFGLFMSRREYKTINRRLQRGRVASAKEGKYVGNKPPYGYKRIPVDGDKGFTLSPIEEQANIVRMIYDLYTHGECQNDGTYVKIGPTLIAKKLNSLKIPAYHGGMWTTNNVRGILINPIYKGKIRWNFRPAVKHMDNGNVTISRAMAKDGEYILTDGLHPAIVSEETFDLAQERFRSNATAPVHYNKPMKNPLAGVVYCALCGHAMTRRPYGKKNRTDTLICNTLGCTNVASDLDLVEKRILKGLEEWLKNYKLELSMSDAITEQDSQITVHENALKSLGNELQTLQKQMDKTYDLLEQGVYDTETFFSRSKSITNRIQDAKDQMQTIRDKMSAENKRKESINNIIPQVERLLQVYGSLSDARAKNDMLKNVLERAEYRKEHSTRWHGSPDDFDVILYPCMPKDKT